MTALAKRRITSKWRTARLRSDTWRRAKQWAAANDAVLGSVYETAVASWGPRKSASSSHGELGEIVVVQIPDSLGSKLEELGAKYGRSATSILTDAVEHWLDRA